MLKQVEITPQLTVDLICCFPPFVTRMSPSHAEAKRFFVKVVLVFILYLIIAYLSKFYPLLSEFTPSVKHSVHFDNFPTSLLWDSSDIL